MVQKLEACNLKQSDFEPCLFIVPKMVLVMYVDDILMWSSEEKHIYKLGTKLHKQGVDLEEDDDVTGFLGLKLTKIGNSGKMMLTQEGLTDRIIKALGLDGTSNPLHTPCAKAPLTKDVEGDPTGGNFSYSSIAGMLLYLLGHSRPAI